MVFEKWQKKTDKHVLDVDSTFWNRFYIFFLWISEKQFIKVYDEKRLFLIRFLTGLDQTSGKRKVILFYFLSHLSFIWKVFMVPKWIQHSTIVITPVPLYSETLNNEYIGRICEMSSWQFFNEFYTILRKFHFFCENK